MDDGPHADIPFVAGISGSSVFTMPYSTESAVDK